MAQHISQWVILAFWPAVLRRATQPPSKSQKRTKEHTTTLQRKSHLCVPRKEIARPQSQFPHSCVCERFHIFSCSRIGRRTLGIYLYVLINRSQTHEWGNWDCGCEIPFLEIFVSNFLSQYTLSFPSLEKNVNAVRGWIPDSQHQWVDLYTFVDWSTFFTAGSPQQ